MQARTIHFRGNEDHPHGSPTLQRFVEDEHWDVQLIEGPVESGKTTGVIGKLYKLMCEMPRSRDGKRRSRILVVRPTYGELLNTVVKDFVGTDEQPGWFPEKVYGKLTLKEPITYEMRFLDVVCEVVFHAFMDASEQVLRKLRSTQFTACWYNEGQYAPLRLFTEMIDRTGRYPSKEMCPNYDRRKRAFLDNNAPSKHDHWIRLMRGDVPIPADLPESIKMQFKPPANWKFYKQPPAVLEVKDPITGELGVENPRTGVVELYRLNPDAENLQWMGANPYLPALAGKPRDQIDRDFRNVSRPARSGTPRYPMFDRAIHVSKVALQPYESRPIILGMDFGLTPGVVFEQVIDRRWYTFREHVADNEGAEELAQSILRVLNQYFPFFRETGITAYGDPQGGWRHGNSSSAQNTSFAILKASGIPVTAPAKKDKPELRMNIGRKLLREGINNGPRVLIDPVCLRLIEALDGGATMKTMTRPGGVEVKEELNKDQHSHICEAWEYPKWGYGEGRDMIRMPEGSRGTGKRTNVSTAGVGTPGRKWSRVSRRG